MAYFDIGMAGYPPKLYHNIEEVGDRSINHFSYCKRLRDIKSQIGDDAWEALKETSFGVFLKLTEMTYVFSSSIVRYFLCHQLSVNNTHELWSTINSMPLRFSLNEFAEITGLNCEPCNPADVCETDHHAFWGEIGKADGEAPTLDELDTIISLAKPGKWDLRERMMLCRLCCIHVFICGIHAGSRIPFTLAKRVLDEDNFDKYPWGREAFTYLVDSIKTTDFQNSSQTIQGLIHAVYIWVFDSVPGLGVLVGNRRDVSEGPSLLHWQGSRKRFKFADFIADEIQNHNQVRVRHMIPVSVDKKYPIWPDNNIQDDPRLDKLIEDLMKDALVPNQWPVEINESQVVLTEEGVKKRKFKETKKTKNPEKLTEQGEEGPSKICADEGVKGLEQFMTTLVGKLEATINHRFNILEGKIEALQGDVRMLKEGQGKSNQRVHLDLEPEVPSWLCYPEKCDDNLSGENVQSKRTPGVAKTGHASKRKKVEGVPTEGERKVRKKENVYSRQKIQHNPKTNKKHNIPKKGVKYNTGDSDFVEHISEPVLKDVLKKAQPTGVHTEPVKKDVLKTTHMSSDDDSEDRRLKESGKKIDAMTKFLLSDQPQPLLGKRVPTLAATQASPFVGNSTVKRIIPGGVSSGNGYDPFEEVDVKKLEVLVEWITNEERHPIGSAHSDVRFFKIMVLPRSEWPVTDPTFGWLADSHIEEVLTIFRLRSMRPNSPFRDRVAFWDPWAMNYWLNEYPGFCKDPKSFGWSEDLLNQYNGLSPPDSPTHKVWQIDIDNLYGCFNINGNHWIAIDVNFPARKIFVYDSIPSLSTNAHIKKCLEPLRRMIPAFLKNVAPAKTPYSGAMFDVSRISKDTPLNEKPGDCGVFSLKYIECLALGRPFDGLCDLNIPAIRERYGAELFEEIPRGSKFASTNPLPRPSEPEYLQLMDHSV